MDLYLCQNAIQRDDVYALLRYAVCRRWGLNTLPELGRTPQGKPFFSDFPDYQFSLSHSGKFALCVLDGHPVGADIETIRSHHPKLAQRICSAEELEWLKGQNDHISALCQLWTCKEAMVKYTGTGLTVPLRSICPPLSPANKKNDLLFHRITTPDYVLCVCGHTPASPLITVSLEEISR